MTGVYKEKIRYQPCECTERRPYKGVAGTRPSAKQGEWAQEGPNLLKP